VEKCPKKAKKKKTTQKKESLWTVLPFATCLKVWGKKGKKPPRGGKRGKSFFPRVPSVSATSDVIDGNGKKEKGGEKSPSRKKKEKRKKLPATRKGGPSFPPPPFGKRQGEKGGKEKKRS